MTSSARPGTGVSKMGRRARSAAAWSLVQGVGGRVFTLVFVAGLARLLSPEEFGLMAAASAFLVVAELLAEQGLGKAIVQRRVLEPEHLDSAFWTQVGGSLAIAGVGIAAAPWLSSLYGRPDLAPVIAAIICLAPVAALSTVHEALLERTLGFRAIAMRRTMGVLVGGSAALALAATGFGVWSLVLQNVVAEAVGGVLLWRASSWRPSFRFSSAALRDLLGFSVHLFLVRGLSVLKIRADHVLIGMFLGPVPLGLYVMAARLVDVANSVFISTFSKISLPAFARLQGDDAAVKEAYRASLLVAALIGFPVSAALIVLAPQIVVVGLGAQWIGVAEVLRISAIAVLVRSLSTANVSLLLAKGRSLQRLVVVALFVVLNAILIVVFVRRGIVVVAAINAACALAMLPCTAWMASRLLTPPAPNYPRLLLPIAAATAGMLAVVELTRSLMQRVAGPTTELLTLVAVGAAGYLLLVWFWSPHARSVLASTFVWIRGKLRSGVKPGAAH